MADYTARFEEVRASAAVAKVWERYVNDTPYAQGIEFDEVVNAVLELGNMAIGWTPETTLDEHSQQPHKNNRQLHCQ